MILYMAEEEASLLRGGSRGTEKKPSAKRQFSVVYEDSQILIADKPLGLLPTAIIEKRRITLPIRSFLIL